jgi:hypothetical protein
MENQEAKMEKREDVWVTATIDGQVVSWINNWFGPPTEAPAAAPTPAAVPPAVAPAVQTPEPAAAVPEPVAVQPAASPAPASSDGTDDRLKSHQAPQGQASQSGSGATDYGRVGYYNADAQVADGVTFLGNYGGQGSGRFDYKWGNSLSYLNRQGNGGAASAQTLRAGVLPSNKEFAIFSDRKCNGDCGFYRPGSVAYHGFDGADKVFLFEFSMPLDGNRGFNGDMPALWFLNAKIPRTQQYGGCTCWPNCGEFDMFEVLDSGNKKCKSTVHANVAGGASDFFDRPIGAPIKVAAVFDSATASISVKILPPDTDFGAGLSRDVVQGWIRTNDGPASSLFKIGK